MHLDPGAHTQYFKIKSTRPLAPSTVLPPAHHQPQPRAQKSGSYSTGYTPFMTSSFFKYIKIGKITIIINNVIILEYCTIHQK
jgi:hypothetical protein